MAGRSSDSADHVNSDNSDPARSPSINGIGYSMYISRNYRYPDYMGNTGHLKLV